MLGNFKPRLNHEWLASALASDQNDFDYRLQNTTELSL